MLRPVEDTRGASLGGDHEDPNSLYLYAWLPLGFRLPRPLRNDQERVMAELQGLDQPAKTQEDPCARHDPVINTRENAIFVNGMVFPVTHHARCQALADSASSHALPFLERK